MIPVSTTETLELSTLLQRLRDVLPQILSSRPVSLAYLFGSAVSAVTHFESDVDVALVGVSPLAIGEQLELELDVQAELARRAGIRRADVRLVNDAGLTFQGQVVLHGILLFSRDDAARVAFESEKRDTYFDFKPFADRLRKEQLETTGGRVTSREKVEELLQQQQQYLKHLRALGDLQVEEFLADPNKTGAAKYYCLVAIETCIDIGEHIIAADKFRAPMDYADVFRVLGENKLFPEDFTRTLEKMAGFRNRLVHVYSDVDDKMVHEFLRTRLGDFEKFKEFVLKFIE